MCEVVSRYFQYCRHSNFFNPLNPELNPICYLLALLAHHFPLPDNTRHSQQTNIHAPVGFEPTISAEPILLQSRHIVKLCLYMYILELNGKY